MSRREGHRKGGAGQWAVALALGNASADDGTVRKKEQWEVIERWDTEK